MLLDSTRFSFIVVTVSLCVGCADGLAPPDATPLIVLTGDASETPFTIGRRAPFPCKRAKISGQTIQLPNSDWVESERIEHSVAVATFCIDQHEVTLGQYRHCHLRGTCGRPRFSNAGNDDQPGFVARYWSNPDKYASYPVVGVVWEDAQAYCRFRGGRLPTEIEWEFAAKSRGRAIPIIEESSLQVSIDGDCASASHAGQIALGGCSNGPSAVQTPGLDITQDGVFGLYGNVAEWTADESDLLAYCEPEYRSEMYFKRDRTGVISSTFDRSLFTQLSGQCIDLDENEAVIGDCYARLHTNPDACNQSCITLEAERPGSGTDCLISCLREFEMCAENCVDAEVDFLCGQLDGYDGCRPMPWCKPRENRQSDSPHVANGPGQASGHIVRGGHFQMARSCNARVTRRRSVIEAESTLGFRCVFDGSSGACRAAQRRAN
ncbi:MAG: formylglycine-generating enzyme family protein [Myxococcota bacterium]|nr:formylglycine-generating enzyme family protein [Myxococcota bacterium]